MRGDANLYGEALLLLPLYRRRLRLTASPTEIT